MTVPKHVIDYLTKADNDDVRELFRICKIRYGQLTQNTAMNFNVGDSVEFDSKKRGTVIRGTIIKVNRKTIHLNAEDGVRWTVHPALLRTVGA